jgi:hypothetical protein
MDKKKLTTYLTLLIGLIVIMIVFFLERKGFGFSTRLRDTYFYQEMRYTFDLNRKFAELVWWLLLLSFSYSWWSLRNCISNVLLKFHKGI